MFILMYTHLSTKKKNLNLKMIIRYMDVLIYGPFQLITSFPTKDVDVQLGCFTIMVPKCPTEGLDLFLNNPKTKVKFDL